MADFVEANPNKVSKSAWTNGQKIKKGFDAVWRNKVRQFQTSIFSPGTKGQWIIRFDDALANALELGPLRRNDAEVSPKLEVLLRAATPKEVPFEMLYILVAYYVANKPDDSNWVVLPVASFDACFGSTSFGRKYLNLIPEEILERADWGFGICRY